MALNERYIIASDLEQYFVDKDSGLPLAAGTLTFFRDTARNVSKEVFQLSGSPPNYTYTSLGAQVTLSSVGTVQNSGGDNEVIYYYPYDEDGNLDLYYVVCRNSDGVEQFTREAWPNLTSANDPTRDQTSLQNQISNPTFTNVFINEGFTTTYSVSAANNEEFAFAPGWDFVISGTGTVIVERVALTGNENIPTNPPYLIDVQLSAGITSCYLRQRFHYNSGLWASVPNYPLFLSGNLVVRNESVGTTGIQMLYAESSGGTPITIVDDTFESSYVILSGVTSSAIPQSTNTDSGVDGYIDIYLSFLSGSHVRVTSVQVIPTASESQNFITYDVNSSDREEALQGSYYIPNLIQKQIDSFLVGWDFPMSPFQFGASGNVSTNAAYISDQTIAFRGSSGNVAWGRDTVTNGLQFTTAGSDDSFCIIQYIEFDQVEKMKGSSLSVHINGYQNDVAGDPVTMRVYLVRGKNGAVVPALPATIGSIDTAGEFTITALPAGDWSFIPRSGLDTAKTTLQKVTNSSEINNGKNDYGFVGWEVTDFADIDDFGKFAIVVTFAYVDPSTVITLNSISVVPGNLPCRPAIKTSIETLQQCQYYYQLSYGNGSEVGTSNHFSQLIAAQSVYFDSGPSNWIVRPAPFGFTFDFKRTTPSVTLYSPNNGTINAVDSQLYVAGSLNAGTPAITSGNWSIQFSGQKAVDYIPVNATTIATSVSGGGSDSASGLIEFHYIADARLGIV